MATLSSGLRKDLENVVANARAVSEEAAEKALKALAVGEAKAHTSMTAEQKALRNRLRAHGRQLGDWRNVEKDTQKLDHLLAECAYEHWHRMLFARFLAENQLLIEPASDVSISIEEVKELARKRGEDWVALAGQFAVRMLPQVFRQDDPVLEVQFAPEDRKRLEDVLELLPADVFTADDSLGWTYQFWQAEQKDAINASGDKIGADELGPVTQLFTEDYMVEFLLHNTLGAWWAGKVLARRPELATSAANEDELRNACGVGAVRWTFLRFVREEGKPWRPAAGTFDGWPKAVKDIRVLDPCMGSGHFLVFALPVVAALRAAEERLSVTEAILATLRDNLFGLELDARCTQIAAFSLALAAWKVTGYEPLPPLQLACSGNGPNVSEKEWTALAGKNDRLRLGMARLHGLFKDAPVLGSLINPHSSKGELLVAGFHELQPLLERALAQESTDDTAHEVAVTARGLAKAAEILAARFTLVATNVPYLGRGNQANVLKEYCDEMHSKAKADLATCFVERCLEFCAKDCTTALVSTQYWLFLTTYKKLREDLFKEVCWNVVSRLGSGAFETIGGEVVNVALLVHTRSTPSPLHEFLGMDVSTKASPWEKAVALRSERVLPCNQKAQLRNPNNKLVLETLSDAPPLEEIAVVSEGLHTGDYPRFGRKFWEVPRVGDGWSVQQGGVTTEDFCSGFEHILLWEEGAGELIRFVQERLGTEIVTQWIKGEQVWGKRGVAVGMMGDMKASLYQGAIFTHGICAIVPKLATHLPAVRAFCESGELGTEVRKLDQKVCAALDSVAKVPFDLNRWQKVAAEKYPDGLPRPFSNDPTQWLFGGHPKDSSQPLQVAVARLAGYQWPRRAGSSFPDCPALGPDGLESQADSDGIVCLPALKGEETAGARLGALLAAVYGKEWSGSKQPEVLAQAGSAGESLDAWLRDGFFEQHCAHFHQRPFLWHIWDGEIDGFHALVNYHNLAAPDSEGRKTLEKLAYTYLGDWIGRQKAEQKQGREGADAKLAAALHLQEQLKMILDGEPPYDLFVRWKPLSEQAIGWEPDINDGVRINIRPFVMAETRKGKSIFRKAPKIKWEKDRGKEPSRPKYDFPWFWGWDEEKQDFKGGPDFDGNRWNDLHYSNAVKLEARARHEKKAR